MKPREPEKIIPIDHREPSLQDDKVDEEEIAKKKAHQEKMLKSSIREFYSTETTFHDLMEKLSQFLFDEKGKLKGPNELLLNPQQKDSTLYESIRSDLEELLEPYKALLNNPYETTMVDKDDTQALDGIIAVTSISNEGFKNMHRALEDCILLYHRINSLVVKMGNDKFKKIPGTHGTGQTNLDLVALLILPIQRAMKYKLLLEAIHKELNNASAEMQKRLTPIEESIKLIANQTRAINEKDRILGDLFSAALNASKVRSSQNIPLTTIGSMNAVAIIDRLTTIKPTFVGDYAHAYSHIEKMQLATPDHKNIMTGLRQLVIYALMLNTNNSSERELAGKVLKILDDILTYKTPQELIPFLKSFITKQLLNLDKEILEIVQTNFDSAAELDLYDEPVIIESTSPENIVFQRHVLTYQKPVGGGKNAQASQNLDLYPNGIYSDEKNKAYFIKKPKKKYELFTELFAGILLEKFKDEFIKDEDKAALTCATFVQLPDNEFALIQPSINITELFKQIGTGDTQNKDRSAWFEAFHGKEMYAQIPLLANGKYNGKYRGLSTALLWSLIIGDYSVHSGNFATLKSTDDSDPVLQFTRIDFGAAFRLYGDPNNNTDIRNPAEYQGLSAFKKLTKNYLANYSDINNLFNTIAEKAKALQKALDKNTLVAMIVAAIKQIPEDMFDRSLRSTISEKIAIKEVEGALSKERSDEDIQAFANILADIMLKRIENIALLQDEHVATSESQPMYQSFIGNSGTHTNTTSTPQTNTPFAELTPKHSDDVRSHITGAEDNPLINKATNPLKRSFSRALSFNLNVAAPPTGLVAAISHIPGVSDALKPDPKNTIVAPSSLDEETQKAGTDNSPTKEQAETTTSTTPASRPEDTLQIEKERQEQAHKEQKNTAAILIQKHYRGHRAKKQYGKLKADATTLQTFLRRNIAVQQLEERKQEAHKKNTAAITIQTQYRGNTHKQEFDKLREAATIIQTQLRRENPNTAHVEQMAEENKHHDPLVKKAPTSSFISQRRKSIWGGLIGGAIGLITGAIPATLILTGILLLPITFGGSSTLIGVGIALIVGGGLLGGAIGGSIGHWQDTHQPEPPATSKLPNSTDKKVSEKLLITNRPTSAISTNSLPHTQATQPEGKDPSSSKEASHHNPSSPTLKRS